MKDSSVLILEAIVKLYNRLDGIVFDSKDNHFMDVTARNGRDVFWYRDEMYNEAVYVDTLEVLSEEEIERELA